MFVVDETVFRRKAGLLKQLHEADDAKKSQFEMSQTGVSLVIIGSSHCVHSSGARYSFGLIKRP